MDQTRERFLHDMELAGLAERTRSHYLDAVRDYSKFFGRSPKRLGHEHLRVWSRHLLDSGVGDGRLRQHFSSLKFLYAKTLARPSRHGGNPFNRIVNSREFQREWHHHRNQISL